MTDHTQFGHIPVLLDTVLDALQPQPGGVYVDGTLGAGGHSAALLEASAPDGRVLAFDRDPVALEIARKRLVGYGERFEGVHASYTQMEHHVDAGVDGILLDLGYSSLQIDDPARGFSFQHEGPLDMRFDTEQTLNAAEIVNTWREAEIADVIYRYGEERHSRRIARAIVAARPIETTQELAELVKHSVPRSREKIHPATRTFQGLRIAINDELGELERVLSQAVRLLRPGGRLAVISFHSLEDRIVKHFLREQARDCICLPEQPMCTCEHEPVLRVITKKPLIATEAEIAANPRARSAKLRVGEKL